MFGKKNIIRMKDDHTTMEIVYGGKIEFNDDYTNITYMSPDAYLTYRKNNRKLSIEKNLSGETVYVINNKHEVTVLDDDNKTFLSEALQEIKKTKHK
jgi:hypothetical protein